MPFDFRDNPGSERAHEEVMRILTGRGRTPDREVHRSKLLDRFGKESERRREALFDKFHPYAHHSRLLHPSPLEARELAQAAFRVRKIGWRGAQWLATMRALDMTNELHWRYVFSIYRFQGDVDDRMWNISIPHRVPTGIPIGSPSAEDRQHWHPEASHYDMDEAALREMEIECGGASAIILHSQIDSGRAARTATFTRLAEYLAYYRGQDQEDLPDDPYDPLNWGHDSRAKSIRLHRPDNGPEILYTPDFDPEVSQYHVDQPLAGCTFQFEFFDPLMNMDSVTNIRGQQSKALHFTVTSKAKDATRYYSFWESPPSSS